LLLNRHGVFLLSFTKATHDDYRRSATATRGTI
jgi:hypothetical protein